MNGRLAGKSAIVTGAAGGIGAATAELFCREGAGVLLVDTNASALEDTARTIGARISGARVLVCEADVAQPKDAAQAVSSAANAFGGVDILINNAAVRSVGALTDSKLEDWSRVLSVNLLGAVNFSKAALPELRRARDGAIVMLSSCYGVVGRAGWPIYDASKAALLALMRTLAVEEAPNGIRVNAVCPGGTLTPFTLARNIAAGKSEEEVRDQDRGDSLLRRWGRPEEIAYPILWLASSEASFVTGATIMVDGGLSAM
jgi:2-hydroxycyclohexanecarboxyl-CoA dehydrogenase